jgi:hypothetical protein
VCLLSCEDEEFLEGVFVALDVKVIISDLVAGYS